MRIPPRLTKLLALDKPLEGSVSATLGEFEPWINANQMVFFPGFTDHGTAHLEGVLRSAESLIADPAWKRLTPADAACLILAVLLHDCAMHLSRDGFIRLVDRGADQRPRGMFIDKMREASWADMWEEFVRESGRWDARRLEATLGQPSPVSAPVLAPGAVWDDNHYLLVGEFLRRHHARLAQEIAVDGVPGPGDDRLTFSGMPEPRMPELAGLIARSHNMPLRSALALLEPQGRKVWRHVHAPYLMTLLRIADYLQIDASRAPRQVLKVRGLRSPISRLEWRKHHAVKDIREHEGDPEAVFVDAEPPDVETFLGLQSLLRDLQREIDESWNALGEVYGSDPKLRDLELTLRRIYSSFDDLERFAATVPYVPVDARFRVSSGEVLKLLVGPLYGDDPSYGVRELMQNALDACRELDDWFAKHSGRSLDRREQQADVVALVEEHPDGSATFSISDRGIGMTPDTIAGYFLTAGASLRHSDTWLQRHAGSDGRPRVMRSGRFGVGVLAAFLIGPEIEVETRFVDSEVGYGFTCRLDSPHVEIVKAVCPVGTRIRVRGAGKSLRRLLDPAAAHEWNWYAAARPTVARGVRYAHDRATDSKVYRAGETIWFDDRPSVPLPEDSLEEAWQVASAEHYQVVHWSTVDRPRFWCNGIDVRAPRYGPEDVPLDSDGVQDAFVVHPRLSVWDPAGKLPVTLRRDGFSASLGLAGALAEPLCRDILAFLLVRLESERFTVLLQLAMTSGFDARTWRGGVTLPRSVRHHSIGTGYGDLHWLGLQQDRVLLIHPAVLRAAGAMSILFVPDPHRPEWLAQIAAEFQEPLVAFQSGVDLHPVLGSLWGTIAMRDSQSAIDPNRETDVRRLFRNFEQCSPSEGEILLLPDEPTGRGYDHFTFGNEGDLSLRDFGKRTSSDAVRHPRLAKWRFAGFPVEGPPSVLVDRWLQILGPKGVPLDLERRRDELSDAYRELAPELGRWERLTTKEAEDALRERAQSES